MLTAEQIERYSRQLVLRSWGSAEQERLGAATVYIDADLPSAGLYLAAAGIKQILIPDSFTSPLWDHAAKLNPDTQIEYLSRDDQTAVDADFIISSDPKLKGRTAGSQFQLALCIQEPGPDSDGNITLRRPGFSEASFKLLPPFGVDPALLLGTYAAAILLLSMSRQAGQFSDGLPVNFGCSSS